MVVERSTHNKIHSALHNQPNRPRTISNPQFLSITKFSWYSSIHNSFAISFNSQITLEIRRTFPIVIEFDGCLNKPYYSLVFCTARRPSRFKLSSSKHSALHYIVYMSDELFAYTYAFVIMKNYFFGTYSFICCLSIYLSVCLPNKFPGAKNASPLIIGHAQGIQIIDVKLNNEKEKNHSFQFRVVSFFGPPSPGQGRKMMKLSSWSGNMNIRRQKTYSNQGPHFSFKTFSVRWYLSSFWILIDDGQLNGHLICLFSNGVWTRLPVV